jgi:uncharacterized integral membrane protein (TIGR00698 family)
MRNVLSSKVLFIVSVGIVITGALSPQFALAAGLAFGILFAHPFEAASRRWSIVVLQFSVVALGFSMNFGQVLHAGRAGFVYTALGIGVAMAAGLLLGRVFNVGAKAAFLISAGTAICGGSAIAALAPITKPDKHELATSIGTVFTLNALALFLFPAIGTAMHLSPEQFGLWSALAIHDTSSVLGAAAKFGPSALATATVVKLTRALWIFPVAVVAALAVKSNTRARFPWFILLFCLAALANGHVRGLAPVSTKFVEAGHIGLALALFLIGSSVTKGVIKQTGIRVITQGLVLWIVVAAGSLVAIRAGWIR